MLFDEPGHPFAEPRPLSPEQALQETQDYFEEWFKSAETFLKTSALVRDMERPKEAAFLMHQATERFYHCLFLVHTLYSPKTHNLNRLRDMAEDLEPSLKSVWPRGTRFDKRCYALLRDAYVKARYSRSYAITAEQLDWIAARVALLETLVRRACESRIETLEEAA